jgi:aryl-alcohol dehydrogenase-like predicted oxidoreductase
MSTSIPRRHLGRLSQNTSAQLEVSAIGLGCMGMSEFYGPADEVVNLEVLNRAIDMGVNFLDTADMYGSGENEVLLSKVLKQRRGEIVLATKFGNMRGPKGEFLGINGRPEYVRSACDDSLSRLGIDCIDLYYQHRVDPNVAIEETVGAMSDLVRAGKVRYLGLSEASANTVRRAHAIHPITALQSEYSIWTRDIEGEILQTCDELGVGFVAYSPLGRGFLTGAIQTSNDLGANDWRRMNPRFSPENVEQNRRLVDELSDIAQARDCTPAQLALAWLLHQSKHIVPIPGTRRISRLEENAYAAQLILTANELQRIDSALQRSPIAGTRYPAAGMTTLNG